MKIKKILGEYLLIKIEEENQNHNKSGISLMLPSSTDKKNFLVAHVLQIGDGLDVDSNKKFNMRLEENDKIIINSYAIKEVHLADHTLCFIKLSDVIAIIN